MRKLLSLLLLAITSNTFAYIPKAQFKEAVNMIARITNEQGGLERSSVERIIHSLIKREVQSAPSYRESLFLLYMLNVEKYALSHKELKQSFNELIKIENVVSYTKALKFTESHEYSMIEKQAKKLNPAYTNLELPILIFKKAKLDLLNKTLSKEALSKLIYSASDEQAVILLELQQRVNREPNVATGKAYIAEHSDEFKLASELKSIDIDNYNALRVKANNIRSTEKINRRHQPATLTNGRHGNSTQSNLGIHGDAPNSSLMGGNGGSISKGKAGVRGRNGSDSILGLTNQEVDDVINKINSAVKTNKYLTNAVLLNNVDKILKKATREQSKKLNAYKEYALITTDEELSIPRIRRAFGLPKELTVKQMNQVANLVIDLSVSIGDGDKVSFYSSNINKLTQNNASVNQLEMIEHALEMAEKNNGAKRVNMSQLRTLFKIPDNCNYGY